MILARIFVRLAETIHTWFRYLRLRLVCFLGLGQRGKEHSAVAILAWTFPPAYSGGVFRPVSWTRHFMKSGQSSVVLAHSLGDRANRAGEALLAQVPDSVEVLRHPNSPSKSPLQRLVPHIDGGIVSSLDLVENAIARFADRRPSVVIASGPPFGVFMAGYLLSRYWRRPLIVDYRDEWTECPFPFVSSGRFDLAWEKRVNAHATSVVCVSQSQLAHHLHTFPFLRRDKCCVIPNGWEPDEAAGLEAAPPRDHSAIRIGFAGTLGDHTLPHRFLDVLAELIERQLLDRTIELHFLGAQSENAAAALSQFPHSGVVHSWGLRSKREAHEFMRSMDILLLLNDTAMARYIPGKLYDYLAADTPILAYGLGGETGRILQETQAGIAVEENSAERLALALRQLDDWSGEHTAREDWLARHTRAHAAESMLALVRDAQSHS